MKRQRAESIVLGMAGDAVVAVTEDGRRERVASSAEELPAWLAEREARNPVRWVWSDTATWYPPLLAAGVRVARCTDLRLCRAILRGAAGGPAVGTTTDQSGAVRAGTVPETGSPGWDADPVAPGDPSEALFALRPESGAIDDIAETLAEHERQRSLIGRMAEAGRLRLLLAAESAGALVAAEMTAAGLPWDAARHDEVLTGILGPRPPGGSHPERMERAAAAVRRELSDPQLSLDSHPRLLRALHRAGIGVPSTSKWALAEHDHPAIEPLLEYKRLARLYAANGWAWLDEWVRGGRFRPVYVPGGVVTGRWASSGGGALQIPRVLRTAVRADPGWRIVAADVRQLEPRVLAAMARDERMAQAAAGGDLYAGVVSSGAVATRDEAKVAMLGAMYGSTTGDSGRLLPRLRRAFPRAMALVDEAAREGEAGGTVRTWLGRTSPAPDEAWHATQSRASADGASGGEEAGARRAARDRGRFTRNFVVQGTAAEWSLAWLADIRLRLTALGQVSGAEAAARSGPAQSRSAHLAFFLHDEVILHVPAALAEQAAEAVREAAASAGRLLFGSFPVSFPLDLHISETATKD